MRRRNLEWAVVALFFAVGLGVAASLFMRGSTWGVLEGALVVTVVAMTLTVRLATIRVELSSADKDAEIFKEEALREIIRRNPMMASIDPDEYAVIDLERVIPRLFPGSAVLVAVGVVVVGIAVGLAIAVGLTFDEGPRVFGPIAGGLALSVSALPVLASAYSDRQVVNRGLEELIELAPGSRAAQAVETATAPTPSAAIVRRS